MMQIAAPRGYGVSIAVAFVALLAPPVGAAPLKDETQVRPAQYERLCDAIVGTDRTALRSLLASDFTSIDTSGKKENRAAFIADLADPGPVALKQCAFDVRSRSLSRESESDRAVWTIKGTFTSSSTTQATTGVAETAEVWVRRDARWQLRSQTIFTLKQWLAGVPEMTQTLVVPLTRNERDAVVAGLREYANPLWGAYPGGAERDLEPILRAAGEARVVAMGEGTHGTSEFFALKDRVFRYSVEHGGVTVFAQETNWSDGKNIERYLQTGEGNLRDLLSATFAVWNNQETLELLQWMRAYNVARPHALHFFGIDMQDPQAAAASVVAFYKRFEPSNAPTVTQAEACVNVADPKMLEALKLKANGPKCVASRRAVFATLANDTKLQAAAGRDAYLDAYHAADVAQQAAAMWSESGLERGAAVRDRAMAHNVEWMVYDLYPRARVFLWAHNGHVGANMEAWPSMGTYLRAALGRNYFAIGQTFDHGGISLVRGPSADVPPAQGNASETIFREAGVSPFFLNFANVPPNTPLARWLAQPHGFREIGAVWKASQVVNGVDEWEVRLPAAYDAITFVDATHAAASFQAPVTRSVSFPPQAVGWLTSVPWTLRSFAAGNASAGGSVLPDGESALYLAAKPDESRLYAWLETHVDAAAYRGKTLHLRGMVATSGVTTRSAMSLAVYGKDTQRPLEFAHAPAKPLAGTNAWTPVDVVVSVPQNAQRIDIDFLFRGEGTAWISDLSLRSEVSAK